MLSSFEDKLKLLEVIKHNKDNFKESNSFREFLVDCKLFCTPSSYGSKIETRWIKDNQYVKVPRTEDRGDYIDTTTNESVEFKVSYKQSKGIWSFLQFRPYQNIDRYDLLCIHDDMSHTLYRIPKDVMISVIKQSGDFAHGTIDRAMDNTNIEYRLTFTPNIANSLSEYVVDNTHKTLTKFW